VKRSPKKKLMCGRRGEKCEGRRGGESGHGWGGKKLPRRTGRRIQKSSGTETSLNVGASQPPQISPWGAGKAARGGGEYREKKERVRGTVMIV